MRDDNTEPGGGAMHSTRAKHVPMSFATVISFNRGRKMCGKLGDGPSRSMFPSPVRSDRYSTWVMSFNALRNCVKSVTGEDNENRRRWDSHGAGKFKTTPLEKNSRIDGA